MAEKPPARAGFWRAKLCTTCLAVILLLVAASVACGGGSTVTHTPGTPAGTYTLTVTATVTSGSATLTHNLVLTLAVD
jgi:ABC-type glycerol-3-phosphate transport system substrate-binding protein